MRKGEWSLWAGHRLQDPRLCRTRSRSPAPYSQVLLIAADSKGEHRQAVPSGQIILSCAEPMLRRGKRAMLLEAFRPVTKLASFATDGHPVLGSAACPFLHVLTCL